MKTLLKIIGLIAAVIYALSSFVCWDFNPSTWEQEGRFLAVLAFVCCFIVAGLTIAFTTENKDDSQQGE